VTDREQLKILVQGWVWNTDKPPGSRRFKQERTCRPMFITVQTHNAVLT